MSFLVNVVFVMLTISFYKCGGAPKNNVPRITGGQDAEDYYPYQVSLQYGFTLVHNHYCGGTILSPKWILTAGHCITELPILPLANIFVKAGIKHLSADSGQVVEVDNIYVHPNYTGDVAPHDIALLKLKEDLVLNGNTTAAINLPETGRDYVGKAILTGWGSTSTTIIPSNPQDLQVVELDLISAQECKDLLVSEYGTSEPFDEDANICTSNSGGKSACNGDSGGPLAQGSEVIGVVSWGLVPCGNERAPSVYTKVETYLDFINETMSEETTT